jgi:hypothetical protein
MNARRGGGTVLAALGAAIALVAVTAAAAGAASSASAGQLETVTIATPPFEPTALANIVLVKASFWLPVL